VAGSSRILPHGTKPAESATTTHAGGGGGGGGGGGDGGRGNDVITDCRSSVGTVTVGTMTLPLCSVLQTSAPASKRCELDL